MSWQERNRDRSGRSAPGRMPLAAVTFDVTGTLIHCPRLGEIYGEVLARHGLLSFDAGVRRMLERTISEVWIELSCRADPRRDRFSTHPEGTRGFWADFLARLCLRLGIDRPSPFVAAELFDRFARSESWALDPRAMPVLERLRRRGLRLGAVSNWDERLPLLLDRLGIARSLDAIVYSAAVGVEKPHPKIFHRALAELGVPPEAALHVGDRTIEDVEGAEAIGMRAWHLDRGAKLDDLLDALGTER